MGWKCVVNFVCLPFVVLTMTTTNAAWPPRQWPKDCSVSQRLSRDGCRPRRFKLHFLFKWRPPLCFLTDSWATKTFILGVFFEKRKKSKKWYYIRSVEKKDFEEKAAAVVKCPGRSEYWQNHRCARAPWHKRNINVEFFKKCLLWRLLLCRKWHQSRIWIAQTLSVLWRANRREVRRKHTMTLASTAGARRAGINKRVRARVHTLHTLSPPLIGSSRVPTTMTISLIG